MANNNNNSSQIDSFEHIVDTQLDPPIPTILRGSSRSMSSSRPSAPPSSPPRSQIRVASYLSPPSRPTVSRKLYSAAPSRKYDHSLPTSPASNTAGFFDIDSGNTTGFVNRGCSPFATQDNSHPLRSSNVLSRNLEALLLENYKKQDFEKYGSIFYERKALVIMMSDRLEPSTNPNAGQSFRDPLRLFALRANGIYPRTIDTISPNSVFPGVHCQSSVNELHHLMRNMKDAFGGDFEPVDTILSDYMRVPNAWLEGNLSPKFFSVVLPHFLANDRILKPRGTIFLPNTPYMLEQMTLNFPVLSQLCESIRLIHEPKLNDLYRATETVEEILKQSSSKVCNESALPVLLQHSNAPFIAMIKRGDEEGDMVLDLTSNLYDKELTSPFSPPAKQQAKKRGCAFTSPTPVKRSNKCNVIDLVSEEKTLMKHTSSSSSGLKGRVGFTPY